MIGGEVGWWGGGGGNYNGERNQLGKLGKFISFTITNVTATWR